jgi:8-amino-7-oxononanoate synthase
MSTRTPERLRAELELRAGMGSLRKLQQFASGVDLSSNDYLGVARRLAEPERLGRIVAESKLEALGATGSRLVTGSSALHDQLEAQLAQFHSAESALLFGSGYEANVGLLASIASRSDTIIYDDSVHASMRDGIRLSVARCFSFRHNSADDLRSKLRNARGECYVAVESLYSMDGDCAPLKELCDVVEEAGAFLIVDEAHATGVYGAQGQGLVCEQGLAGRVFARVHTFGKALGYRGACVVGPAVLRDYLINSSRPFIYSTAHDALSLLLIREAYSLIEHADAERAALFELIEHFCRLRVELAGAHFLPVSGPIQALIVPGNHSVRRAEELLQRSGFFAKAIRAPTVPAGTERIRVCLHSFNTRQQLDDAVSLVTEALAKGEAA